MSRASKITLALSCVLTTATIVGVHFVQEMERETLHQGPIKDAKRIADKRAAREAAASLKSSPEADPVETTDVNKERKKLLNKAEHEQQLELRKKYQEMQPLSGEVVTKDGEVVERK
ncbi:Pet117p Ecym_4337 [Eremothecium cymbalariae DBVPG|uniref:Uncharacterized protein n=1 Tax=Eremothecium cymbalariae (strain CBS 270.75 / DBVPG 7215 / KCTC 17166 / NRRL Y-17582) TaxID=931890 RepID=G8JTP6_ERECY|nr:hypothetical protein Ecym_4337 [Eremothecium cymbalariae DBVPG\